MQAGQETRSQEEEGKLKGLLTFKSTVIRFRLPGGENLAVSAEFGTKEPLSAIQGFLREAVLTPGTYVWARAVTDAIWGHSHHSWVTRADHGLSVAIMFPRLVK